MMCVSTSMLVCGMHVVHVFMCVLNITIWVTAAAAYALQRIEYKATG